jgi:hypothetical protein
MVRKAAKQPQHLYFVAKINEVDVAYGASQDVGLEFRDSFDLNIKATVEKIPEKLNGITQVHHYVVWQSAQFCRQYCDRRSA